MQTRVEKKPSTTKRMIIMIIGVVLLIALIAGIKVLMVMHMIHNMPKPTPAVVTTAVAEYQTWQPTVDSVGTLRAVRGADLALDIAGLVTQVNMKSGDDVKQGQVLVQLRDTEDVALLQQLQAAAALSRVTYERAKQQLAVQAISKADYDSADADYKGKQAAVAQQQVTVSRKQLRAPFAGRAGIITVNPGDYLNSGTTIVTVQQLDPLYVDFYAPQGQLDKLKVGQRIALTLDAFPGRSFDGQINAISPKVDPDTRNVQIEATIPNPDRLLTPGMYARVGVDAGSQQRHLTLPQTAVVYNPYGDTVYVVQPSKGKDDKGNPEPPTVQQAFVTTGPTRGDQVSILKGIDAGAIVVTSGQLKLKSGAQIKVDNRVTPADSPNPTPQEH